MDEFLRLYKWYVLETFKGMKFSASNRKTWRRQFPQRLISFMGVIGFSSLVLVGCATSPNKTAQGTDGSNNAPQAQTSSNPAATNDSPADMTVDPGTASSTVLDNPLLVRAAQDNRFEIEAGQVASQKATDPQVKQFAQMMVRDHTRATAILQQLADARNLTLPTDMGDPNQAVLARLSSLSGKEFDRAYMTEMVNSHQKDVALAENQAQNGKDSQLKSLAAQKLPALEQHLQMAQQLAQQMGS